MCTFVAVRANVAAIEADPIVGKRWSGTHLRRPPPSEVCRLFCIVPSATPELFASFVAGNSSGSGGYPEVSRIYDTFGRAILLPLPGAQAYW